MVKNDNLTLPNAIMQFKEGSIDQVIAEISCHEQLSVAPSKPDKKSFNVVAALAGKDIGIANISLSGEKYIANFGVMPERDFENDEATRKEAEEMIGYMKKIFGFYA